MFSLLSISSLLVLAAHLLNHAPLARADGTTPGFPIGPDKARGVALGGWFILHPWLTPSLFEATGNDAIIDEWTFCEMQDTNIATAALHNHWDTFYTEDDFAAIAAAGLNHVRIPVGYWFWEVGPGEPYIQGQLPYLKRAIQWASKYNLQVVLALYGAPGSQNGFVNSGHILDTPGWASNTTNVNRTIAIVETLVKWFAYETEVVPVIAPLNEAAGFLGPSVLDVLRQYLLDVYPLIRYPNNSTNGPAPTVMLFHDAFQQFSYWDGFLTTPEYERVAMETHYYQNFFDTQLTLTWDEHIEYACSTAANLSSFDLWTMVGEFCPAPTDCATWINGRGVGAYYDGTAPNSTALGSCDGLSGSADTFSDDYKAFLRKYWEAQTIAYESGVGWTHWPWKTEAGAGEEWSYSKGLEYGWIPQNVTDRMYPDICG